jgi:hypothetical protein
MQDLEAFMSRVFAASNAFFFAMAASTVHAQDVDVVEQPRCWMASTGYSPGATIRAGETVMECQADFTWAPTTKNAAGCLSEGRLSNTNDVLNGPNAAAVKVRCLLDGTWEALPAAE